AERRDRAGGVRGRRARRGGGVIRSRCGEIRLVGRMIDRGRRVHLVRGHVGAERRRDPVHGMHAGRCRAGLGDVAGRGLAARGGAGAVAASVPAEPDAGAAWGVDDSGAAPVGTRWAAALCSAAEGDAWSGGPWSGAAAPVSDATGTPSPTASTAAPAVSRLVTL